MNSLRTLALGIAVAAAALGCRGDETTEATEVPVPVEATLVPATADAIQLGIRVWEVRDDGTITGRADHEQKAVLFRTSAEGHKIRIRSELPEVGEYVQDETGHVIQNTFSPTVERMHQALIVDMHALPKPPFAVNQPIVFACCFGCGPQSSGQLTKWWGTSAGWCHLQATGSECCGLSNCWDITGGCYWWY
jgi:hypothetical protein